MLPARDVSEGGEKGGSRQQPTQCVPLCGNEHCEEAKLGMEGPKGRIWGFGESGSEVIDESHPLWGQLGWLHDSEQDSAQLTWYTSLRYEGRRVTKGTFAMYQTAEAGEPMVAVVINPLQVDSEWCLVVNDFAKYPDGSTVMCRDSHHCIHRQLLVNEKVVVRLLEGIQFTPFVGVQWPDEIVALVPEH